MALITSPAVDNLRDCAEMSLFDGKDLPVWEVLVSLDLLINCVEDAAWA